MPRDNDERNGLRCLGNQKDITADRAKVVLTGSMWVSVCVWHSLPTINLFDKEHIKVVLQQYQGESQGSLQQNQLDLKNF